MDNIKLKSILSPDVISVTTETPLSEALSILSKKRISCLLVMENNEPLGIITERDVVKIAAGGRGMINKKLPEVMSSPVKTVPSGMDIVEGYSVLREGKIRHLVVADEEGAIEGVVTQTNIIKELEAKLSDRRSVFEIMTGKIVVSRPDDTIHEISRKMAKHSISCVIIEDESKPIGIITERDMARILLSGVDISSERVSNWMSSPVYTIDSNVPVPGALHLMIQKKHRRLIVHDDKGKSIGLVTQSDIVRGMLEGNYIKGLRASLDKQELVLRKSEKRYKQLFTNMLNGFVLHEVIVDEDNRPLDYIFLELNDTFETMTGLKRSEIIEKKVTEVLPGIYNEPSDWTSVYGKVGLRGKEGTRFDQYCEPLGKWYSVYAYWPQEKQLAVILVDITGRIRAEEERKKKEQFIQLVQEVTVTANEAETVEEAIQLSLNKFCNYMNWPVGHVYVTASTGTLVPSKIWHVENRERFKVFQKATEGASFEPGIGLPGRVLATGKPAWITDVTKDSNFPRAELAKDLGVKAAFGLPVLEGKKVVAVMEFFAEEAVEPDEPLLETLSNLAVQVGRVTERKRAAEALYNKTELLNLLHEITTTVNETRTAKEAMQICVDKICSFTGWPIGHVYITASTGTLVPSTIWHIENKERFKVFRKVTEDTSFETGIGLPGRVLATGKPAWIRDVTKVPWFLRTKPRKDIGVKAAFAFPVLEGKKVVAVLEFFADEVAEPDGTILEALSNLAVQIGRVTERKRAEEERHKMEEKLRQTQKLESLGVLAGGIAHDFNNILTGILGNTEFALDNLPPDSPARSCIEQIQKGGARAAELSNQMLAYSGKGKFIIKNTDVNEIIKKTIYMLKPSISKNHPIKYDLTENLPSIEVDVTQIGQVIINLLINASEAIGENKGVISVSTSTEECGGEECQRCKEMMFDVALPKGQYVVIEVADTGEGMDKDAIEKIFDPFYTTKLVGRGLGMPVVLGIISGHKGAINIESKPGKGTKFTICLPSSGKASSTEELGMEEASEPWRGSGTVLVVDDEETVRTVAKRMLGKIGFTILTAGSGHEAIEIFRDRTNEIDGVLLDLTMPIMNGEECFHELRKIRKDIRVIIFSGFSNEETANRFIEQGVNGFLQKPFNLKTLRNKMRKVFESNI